MLSRFVIAFLPRSKLLLILWLQSPSAVILEPKKIVSHCFHCFPIYFPWSGGTGCQDFSFLNVEMLSSKPDFSLSSFTFIKNLLNFSSFSAIRLLSSVYLRLLIFLLAILISVCASSSLAFLMMYSAYKLNKQGDNIQPWYTPFQIWSQSIVPCLVLTCFLICIQISQEAGKVVWYSHLFQNFPQFAVIHTVKGFDGVNKAEIDVFLELSWFFYDPMNVGNLISGSTAYSKSSLNIWKFVVHLLLKPGLENFEHYFASMWDECNCAVFSSVFSKSSLNIWKFLVHILLKPGLENFEHYFASIWDECNCAVVWTFFDTAFLWD